MLLTYSQEARFQPKRRIVSQMRVWLPRTALPKHQVLHRLLHSTLPTLFIPTMLYLHLQPAQWHIQISRQLHMAL